MPIDPSKVVVLDNGGYEIKVGAATDAGPRTLPNAVMKTKGMKALYVGSQIESCKSRAQLAYRSPFERGYMIDAELQREIWTSVFTTGVIEAPPSETTLVVSEPVFNFEPVQESLHEIAFEEFGFEGLFRAPATDLCAFRHFQSDEAHQKGCLMVDAGHSFTHVVPYFNAKRLDQGVRRLDIGGKALTNRLQEEISFRQVNMADELHVVNQIKEDTCYVTEQFGADIRTCSKRRKKATPNPLEVAYELPDFETSKRGSIVSEGDGAKGKGKGSSQVVTLGPERFSVPELLFAPSDAGVDQVGVAGCVASAVEAAPPGVQPSLFANIRVVGGTSRFSGFRERLASEVRAAAPAEFGEFHVRGCDAPELEAWRGGCAVAHMPAFQSVVVTRQEYNEKGHALCQKRFADACALLFAAQGGAAASTSAAAAGE